MQTGRTSRRIPWASHVYIIEATLAEYGFEHIADDLARSEVPFVTEKDTSPFRMTILAGRTTYSNHLTGQLHFTGASSKSNEVAETLSCLVF